MPLTWDEDFALELRPDGRAPRRSREVLVGAVKLGSLRIALFRSTPAPPPTQRPRAPEAPEECLGAVARVPEAFRGLPVPEGNDLRMLDGTETPEELVAFFGLRRMPDDV